MSGHRKPSTSKPSNPPTGRFVTRTTKAGRAVDSKTGRVVLFPTEPSKLGRKRIEEAVDRVTSKK